MGLHAFALLMNAFTFGPGLSNIALYSVKVELDKTYLWLNFCNHDVGFFKSYEFLLPNFKFQAVVAIYSLSC